MEYTKLFFFLSFIVFIIVILNVDRLTDALLAGSLFINFITMFANTVKMDKEAMSQVAAYNLWDHYKKPVQPPYVASVAPYNTVIPTQSMDLSVTDMAKSRSRDKSSINSAITKTADYFGYHYGNELKDNENRPWWGRNEV